jgi:uncharacterized Zn-binding protein involved in type VI secretion
VSTDADRVVPAVEGEPAVTATVPVATPSSENVTVPEGSVEPTVAGAMAADTDNEAPNAGVVVEGVTTVVVVVLATVKATAGEVEVT